MLAVFPSCPLERGGSQLERGARGYALSPLCGETHGGLERLGAGAERKSEREHTWGAWFFFIYFFSFLTELRLVSFFSFFFLRGPFRCRDICCREDRFTGGTLYWREGCFLSNCQRHLVTDADSQNKHDFRCRGRNAGTVPPNVSIQWFKAALGFKYVACCVAMVTRHEGGTCVRSCSFLDSQGGSLLPVRTGHNKLTPITSPQTGRFPVKVIPLLTVCLKADRLQESRWQHLFISGCQDREKKEGMRER